MSIIIFLIVLVVLIVGHEFGHLLAAKWAGMRVPEFGIGFPPKLWGIRIGDTEYTLNALPFGGFVRIVGEDGESSHADAFTKKSKLAQAAVLVAGPCANVLLGFLAFWAAFMFGVPLAVPEGAPRPADARVVITEVLPKSPAEQAGILAGDTVLGVRSGDHERAIVSPAELTGAFEVGGSALIVRRGEEVKAFPLAPVSGLVEGSEEKVVGIGTTLVGTESFGFFEAAWRAASATLAGLVAIAVGLGTLIAGAVTWSASVGDLSGPVGIASMVGDAARIGGGFVLSFAAIISLNLALLNLLPFPALDGGRLLFLIVEAVRGKPIPGSIAEWLNTLGFALLIALMLAVTWNDITKLML